MQETLYCDNCGSALRDRSCQLVCPKCHVFYSCSDFVYYPEPAVAASAPAQTTPKSPRSGGGDGPLGG